MIETVCPRDCPDSCFISVEMDRGRIVSSRGSKGNPVTQGFTCPRGVADPRRTYSKDRVLYPHLRNGPKPLARFEKRSWSEALDQVADRIRETLKHYGADSILLLDYEGNTGLLSSKFTRRLWNTLGVTRTDYAICSESGHTALALHYGLSYGVQPEELLGMKMITFWGFNARFSSPHQWALSLRARRERGTIIAVVDPRRSETADAADMWLNPRPGSDVALAYGIARYLIEHGYTETDFLRKWTRGYDRFGKEVMRWTPDRVEQITDLDWAQVERLSEAYAKNRPAVVMIGLGLQKSMYGAEAVRAISLIPALAGYHRGFYYTNSRGRFINFDYLTGESLVERESRAVSQVALGSRLEAGEFKLIYIYGMNPALTLPDQRSVRRGLSREDVYVVINDTHWTETAEYADIIFPAPTFLEKDDIVIPDAHPYIRIAHKAIEPLGNSRDEVWVMRELAKRLELKESWLFEDPWEAVKRALEGAFEEGGYQDLLSGAILRLKARPREEYQTPTGKIEFYSTKVDPTRTSPLPSQLPIEGDEKQFVLLNSALPKFTHTQFQDVYGNIPQVVWINPKDAKARGIEEGERVKLCNELGEIELHAILTDRISKGILWSPRPLIGLNGEPQNALVPPLTQAIGGGPFFNSMKVKIERYSPEIR